MSDNRPPYHRRKTKPLPREELAPIASVDDDDIDPEAETQPNLAETERLARATSEEAITMTKCPLCLGQGMTAPEIASTFESLITQARDKA